MKNKIINIVSQTIYFMFLAVSAILFLIILSLGIIPMKYLILGLIIIGVIYVPIGLGVFIKKVNSSIKIILSLICIIFIMGYVFVFHYLDSTLHFMERIRAGKYQIDNYYVIVNVDSNFNDVNNISSIGIYEPPLSKYDEALKQLDEKIDYEKTNYNSYTTLTNALFNNEVDAILMSASNKDIVSELISDFNNKIKTIYTIEIKSKNEVEISEVNVTKESFNIYVSGIDIFGDINSVSRSDVNMVITVNPTTHQVLLTSIPRDYYVQLHGTEGSRDKLTHAGLYGINMSIETIEDLLDINIDYYVRVNFTTLVNLVDAIGGIEVYSDTAVTAWTDPSCYFPVGNIKLDGKCALAYSRERYGYIDGDRHRVRNQQDVIKAIMNKALSSKTLITKYTQILESMGSSFQTNIPSEKIYDLINKQLDSMPNWDVYSYSLNGSDSSNITYTYGEELLYVMEPNMDTVKEAINKINLLMEN